MTTIRTDVSASKPPTQGSSARHAATRTARRREFRLLSGLGHLALACWALIVLLPIAWTFISSLKTGPEIFGDAWTLPKTLHFDNFARAWTKAHVGTYMLN